MREAFVRRMWSLWSFCGLILGQENLRPLALTKSQDLHWTYAKSYDLQREEIFLF
jgi:hypothetical protein